MKRLNELNANLHGSAICIAARYRPKIFKTFSLFFFIVLLYGGNAQAQSELSKVWFNAGFYSAHFDTKKGLRNPNPGFGVEYKLSADRRRFYKQRQRAFKLFGRLLPALALGRREAGGGWRCL